MNDQIVTEYTIVSASHGIDSILKKVAEKIKEGFQPFGGVCLDGGGGTHQAMVKYGAAATLESSIPEQKPVEVKHPKEVTRIIDSSRDSIFGNFT